MLALLGIGVNLYEDAGGVPGAPIEDRSVAVGDTFFVEITAQDLRATPQGVNGLSLDLRWDAAALEVITSPFNPSDQSSPLVTSAFRGFRSGTLDESNSAAMIDELRGVGPSQSGIGVQGPERFSLIHFRADQASAQPLRISIGDIGAGLVNYLRNLQGDDFAISQPVITVGDTGDGGGEQEVDPPTPPALTIAGSSVMEGHTGQTFAAVTVGLSQPAEEPVSVRVTTVAGTATSGVDYLPLDQVLSFVPGGPSVQTVHVSVLSDTAFESDETFQVQFSEPVGATLQQALATVTIQNDDPQPVVPRVDYTLLLLDPAGQDLPRDASGRYQLEAGQSFVAQVFATDSLGDTTGGVFAAFVDLLAAPQQVTWDPASLAIDGQFANATSGSVAAGQGLVDEAGGTAGTQPTGGGVPHALLQVTGQLAPQLAPGTTVAVSLDAADALQHETLVFGSGLPAVASYQSVAMVVLDSDQGEQPLIRGWQNLNDPLDVNGDGLRTPRDVLLIVNELNRTGPHLLTGSGPGTDEHQLDVNGDGGVSRLDALLIFNFLTFGILPDGLAEGEGPDSPSSGSFSPMAGGNSLLADAEPGVCSPLAAAVDYLWEHDLLGPVPARL